MGLCFQFIDGPGPKMRKGKKMNIEQGFVWVVGRREPNTDPVQWHIQGITETESLAIEMCVDETYFIGPVPINVSLSHNRIEWVGSYFPLEKRK